MLDPSPRCFVLPSRRVVAILIALVLGLAPVALGTQSARAATRVAWGVYTAPGPKGVIGAAQFASVTKINITHIVDFLPDDSWFNLTRAEWAITPHTDSPYQLVLSVPMIPNDGTANLAACATGSYNQHWRTIAGQLSKAKLAHTIVRPGWEANGGWYPWTAVGHTEDYINCFRQLVTTMRTETPGLRFDWTMAAGQTPMNGELAYPGSAYVDVIGVDVYDYSWTWYPVPAGVTTFQAQKNAVAYMMRGPRGLNFWSTFAIQHDKPLSLPEWGLSSRSDGHGGGDNVQFVDAVLGFVKDPANRVEFAAYFNGVDTPSEGHRITGANSKFPYAAQRIFDMARWETRRITRHGGASGPPEPATLPAPPTKRPRQNPDPRARPA